MRARAFPLFFSPSFPSRRFFYLFLMASLHVLGRGAAVAVRSASSSRPASFAQQQQRASWVRGAASNDAVSRVFLFSPSTMMTKPKLFFVQPSSPARSFVLLHEDRERSRCDIFKEESPRQALKTWLRSALVGFEMMLCLDDSAPPPPLVSCGWRRPAENAASLLPSSSALLPPFFASIAWATQLERPRQ